MSLSVRSPKRESFDKFNSLRGGLVALHESARVAALHEATLGPLWDLDGMVFSEQPIQIGHAFDVVILEMRAFGMPLSFGLTSVPPRQVLKFRSCKRVLTDNEFWYFSRSSVYCEGEGTRLKIALPLLQLKVGEGFGCRVNDTGHLILRINGVDVGMACDGLPTDRLLWGWVNVDSRVAAVQSQYTSGAIVLRYFGRPYISASPAYKQYLCLFCKDIPHQPCTLKCCGKVSCRECGKGAGTCPGCGGRVTLVTDAPLERRIKEVRVFCPNAGRGCSQLRSMSLMDVIKHRCKFQAVCSSDSSGELQDPTCRQKLSFESMRTRLANKSQRKKSVTILSSLAMSIVSPESSPKSSVSDSSQESLQQQPTSSLSTGSPVAASIERMMTTLNNFEFVVDRVTDREAQKSVWQGKPFYSFTRGYKLSIGLSFGANFFNYMFAVLLRGEYDDELHWPFSATIRCQLLRRDGSVHHTALRYVNEEDGQRIQTDAPRGMPLYNIADEGDAYWQPKRFKLVQRLCVDPETDSFKLRVTILPY